MGMLRRMNKSILLAIFAFLTVNFIFAEDEGPEDDPSTLYDCKCDAPEDEKGYWLERVSSFGEDAAREYLAAKYRKDSLCDSSTGYCCEEDLKKNGWECEVVDKN